MKTIKLLFYGLLLLTSFLSMSQELDGLYANNNEQIAQTLKSHESQKLSDLHNDAFNLRAEANEKNDKTLKIQNATYEVIIQPVTKNKSAVSKILLKILGPTQNNKIEALIKNGGSVLQNATEEEANNLANQLRKLDVNVEVVQMENDASDPMFLVRLMSAGTNESKVIKLVADLSNINLKEAKDIVDRLGVVSENNSKKESEHIKKILEAVGAKVRIEETSASESQTPSETVQKEKKKTLKQAERHQNVRLVQKHQTASYQVIVQPVTNNKSAVSKVLLKILVPNQNDKIEALIKNGGSVLQNATKEEANNLANQLRKLDVNVEVVQMESDASDPMFLVRLMSAGKNKSKVIKLVTDLSNINLKEAKEIVDRLGIISENSSKKEAEYIKKILEAAGAKVRVEEMSAAESQTPSMAVQKEKKTNLKQAKPYQNVKLVDKPHKVEVIAKLAPDSEYQRLYIKIKEQLDVKTEAGFRKKLTSLINDKKRQNNGEISRLAKKTGWDSQDITMMAMAQEKSAKTGIPAQLYYAIYREAIPTGETTLFITDEHKVKQIWEKAIKEHRIDASFKDQLNIYLQKFIQQKQTPLPKDLPGNKRR